MKPLRVLAVIEATAVSGPAKNLLGLGRNAQQPGDDCPRVELAIATYQRADVTPFIRAARANGLEILVIKERYRFDFAALAQLRQAIVRHDPDILQSHNTKSHLFVRLLGLHHRYPWIAFNHGYTRVDWRDRLYSMFDRWSLRAALRVVTVCGPFASELVQRGVNAERIRIQHNSVPAFVQPGGDSIERVRRDLVGSAKEIILTVGRLSLEKGHSDLLLALRIMAQRGELQDRVAILLGDGPERIRLQRLATKLGIHNHVRFAGHDTDVRPYYAIATVLALPSHSEGSPNVVLEAMAAGLSIAATRAGGIPEILEHQSTALLCAPHDPNGLADSLSALLCNSSLRDRLSAAARSKAESIFTADAYRRNLVTIYQGALLAFRPRPRAFE